MTILSAIVHSDRAIVWTDSEMYDRCGRPAGRCNKLHIIAVAPVVAVAVGWSKLAAFGEAALRDAGDVDEAALLVSGALRQNAARVVVARPGDERDFAAQACVVAGWSKASQRFLGYHLSGTSFFTPILFNRIASPEPPGFAIADPRCDADVKDLATEQIDQLREVLPDATGGDLVVAHLGQHGAAINIFRDFAAPQPQTECSP